MGIGWVQPSATHRPRTNPTGEVDTLRPGDPEELLLDPGSPLAWDLITQDIAQQPGERVTRVSQRLLARLVATKTVPASSRAASAPLSMSLLRMEVAAPEPASARTLVTVVVFPPLQQVA